MKYPAIISKSDGLYLVEFPGLEGCLTEGKTLTQALLSAKEALTGWLESNYERNLTVKKPDKCLRLATRMISSRDKIFHIPVSAVLTLAYQMRFSRQSDGEKSLQQLADLMKMSQQNYSKVFENPRANPTLESIERGLSELGYCLEINIIPQSEYLESDKLKIRDYSLPPLKKKRA